jgi:ATP-dependent DNA helicase RecG
VAAGEPLPESLTPIYPTTAGLAQSALRKLPAAPAPQRRARRAARGPAPQPQPARAARGAAPAARAAAVGRALDIEDRGHPAWQRIKLDELLAQQISLRRAYAARRAKNAPGCCATP